jgi:hypothetical protein
MSNPALWWAQLIRCDRIAGCLQGDRGRNRQLSQQVMTPHDEDLKLIRQIVASDGRKYTAGNIDRSKYDRLVDMGWLTPFKTNISDVVYQATDEGRTAAVANGP